MIIGRASYCEPFEIWTPQVEMRRKIWNLPKPMRFKIVSIGKDFLGYNKMLL